MSALPFVFANPAILGALVALPVIWWLLRLTPPRPKTGGFPPLRILATVLKREETPAQSPWWLTLLRMLMAAAVILAIADPVFNPRTNSLAAGGPLVLFVDNSWATAPDWERRVQTADALIDDAESAGTPVSIVFTADPTNNAVPGTAAAARDKLRAAEPQAAAAGSRAAPSRRCAPPQRHQARHPRLPLRRRRGQGRRYDRAQARRPPARRSPADRGRCRAGRCDHRAPTNAADAMTVNGNRLDSAGAATLPLNAVRHAGPRDRQRHRRFPARRRASPPARSPPPSRCATTFARVSIDGGATAGAVHLLDDGFKRRRVVLLVRRSAATSSSRCSRRSTISTARCSPMPI